MIRRLTLLLLLVASVFSPCHGQVVRMPVPTYIPLRANYPTRSPFYMNGQWPNTQIDMLLFYGGNPPAVANATVVEDGWILRRRTATQTEIQYLYAGGVNTRAYKYIRRFHGDYGWAMESYQWNFATISWQQTGNTGWTLNSSWYSDYDSAGFSSEYQDLRFVGSDGKLAGTVTERLTTTQFTLRPRFPKLLPDEIIVEFQGEKWGEPNWLGTSLITYWGYAEVVLYPGDFSTSEIIVPISAGKNNRVIFYRIRPTGLMLN